MCKCNFTSPPPSDVIGLVISRTLLSFIKVFIFDDDKDHASIIGVNATKIEAINTAHLTWSRENFTVESGLVEVLVSGVNESLIGHQGTINLKVSLTRTILCSISIAYQFLD